MMTPSKQNDNIRPWCKDRIAEEDEHVNKPSEIGHKNQGKFLNDTSESSTKHKSSYENISFGKRRHWFNHSDNSRRHNKQRRYNNEQHSKKPKSNPSRFRFGNYHQYYGYRNQQGQLDSRIMCMKNEWFEGKDVLDIGCNAGHFTLTIARDFAPRSIIGMDIDGDLVKMAIKNVRHYLTNESSEDGDFPESMAICYGPIAQAIDPQGKYPAGGFPFNVQFVQGNYILPTDETLEEENQFFDTILCLSLTKWVHLNWGDTGIIRLFHRIFKQLKPGGHLLLEAQAYQSYARKKKITEEALRNYNRIKLLPEKFNEYLLKEVGFQNCELVDTPAHSSQGFSRPIYLFTKTNDEGESSSKKSEVFDYSSEEHCEDSDVDQISD